jgi:hypothetical protein
MAGSHWFDSSADFREDQVDVPFGNARSFKHMIPVFEIGGAAFESGCIFLANFISGPVCLKAILPPKQQKGVMHFKDFWWLPLAVVGRAVEWRRASSVDLGGPALRENTSAEFDGLLNVASIKKGLRAVFKFSVDAVAGRGTTPGKRLEELVAAGLVLREVDVASHAMFGLHPVILQVARVLQENVMQHLGSAPAELTQGKWVLSMFLDWAMMVVKGVRGQCVEKAVELPAWVNAALQDEDTNFALSSFPLSAQATAMYNRMLDTTSNYREDLIEMQAATDQVQQSTPRAFTVGVDVFSIWQAIHFFCPGVMGLGVTEPLLHGKRVLPPAWTDERVMQDGLSFSAATNREWVLRMQRYGLLPGVAALHEEMGLVEAADTSEELLPATRADMTITAFYFGSTKIAFRWNSVRCGLAYRFTPGLCSVAALS